MYRSQDAPGLGKPATSEAGDRIAFHLPLLSYCKATLYYIIFVKHSGTKKDGQKRLYFHQEPEYDKIEELTVMDYTAADVKKLREQTGATFADSKNALVQAENWDEAIKILEVRSGHKAEKMMAAGRETKQGGIFSYVHHNHNLGVLLELNCSTDFVARSHSFRQLANDLALQIAGVAPKYINFEDVPAEVVEEARYAILDDPSMERVPPARRDEVVDNKLKKVLGEQVLMMQPWVKDETVIVGDLVKKVIAETGENIVLRRFSRFALGEEV
jgi:elongation factor Ts